MSLRLASTLLQTAVLLASLALGSCGKKEAAEVDAYDRSHANEEIDAKVISDADGSMKALYEVASAYTQVVKASPSSSIAGARLAIAPGAFDIDMEVILEEGQTLTSKQILTQLAGSDVQLRAQAPSALFMWTFDDDATEPVTVMIPEPKADAEDDAGSLAVFYIKNVPDADTHVIGMIPATELKTGGGLVRFRSSSFGIFQAVLLSKAPASVVTNAPTDIVPVTVTNVKTPPDAFTLTAIPATLQPAKVRVVWEASGQAKSYTVYLDQVNADCSAPYKTYEGITGTSKVIEPADGESFVCVAAKNGAGSTNATGNGTVVRVDITAPLVPAKPTSAGPVSTRLSFKFFWQSVADVGLGGVTQYYVEVRKVPSDELFFSGPVSNALEVDVGGFNGESYRARVAAADASGNESAWSEFSDSVLISIPPTP